MALGDGSAQSNIQGAEQGAKAGAAFGPYGAAIGAAIGLLLANSGDEPAGKGGGGMGLNFGAQSTTQTNTSALSANDIAFNPSVGVSLGGGQVNPSIGGGITSSIPVNQTPFQTVTTPASQNPLSGLYATGNPVYPNNLNPAGAGGGVALSGNTLLLLGGLLLLMMMSFGGHHGKRR